MQALLECNFPQWGVRSDFQMSGQNYNIDTTVRNRPTG